MIKKVFLILFCLYAPSALLGSLENPEVVVIGAGFAGLTAAYRLNQQGLDVEVYEARQRVGGRVFSVNILGQIAELGALNIRDGGRAENLLALVEELHLETEVKRMPFRLAYGDEQGMHDFQTLLQERHFDKEALAQELQDKAKEARNMEELLLALFKPDDILYKMCSALLAGYEGACPAKLSSQCFTTLYHMLLGGLCAVHPNREIERLIIRGGNGQLAERLAQALAPKVHLNEQLTEIHKKSEGTYLLIFKSGKQVLADRLILTLPCPVYNDLRIDEAVIPKERQETIRALPCGTTSKILVPIQLPIDGGCSVFSEHVSLFHPAGGPVLTLYYFNAHASFTPDTVESRFQETLPLIEKFYTWQDFAPDAEAYVGEAMDSASEEKRAQNDTESSLANPVNSLLAQDASFALYTGPVGHSWPNDPFAQGSYSYIPADQEEAYTSMSEIENERVKTLFAPIDGTLFFAGEHTCIDLDICGTMEAAVESGERTARLLLETVHKARSITNSKI